jgi:hypothetical protein
MLAVSLLFNPENGSKFLPKVGKPLPDYMTSYPTDTAARTSISHTLFTCPSSFCIGGPAHVYEGRGWDIVGTHAPNYNNRSIGICFIGDFRGKKVDTGLNMLTTKR